MSARIVAVIGTAPAFAGTPLHEPVTRMIEAAAVAGDPAALGNVADADKAAYPGSGEAVDDLVRKLKADAETQRIARLQTLRFYQGWSGEGEIGASRTSGNTDDTTLAVGLQVKKEGLRWRHKFNAAAEYQRSRNVSGTERYQVSYEPNYKFNGRLFSFGLLQWEKDRFAGFYSRTTEAFGLGYSLLQSEPVRWDVTAGPAFRQTDQVQGPMESSMELRLASQFAWHITPRTALTEALDIYVGGDSSTFSPPRRLPPP
jgi:putative salt-induced outer membrane protein